MSFDLRAAALEIFTELQARGVKANREESGIGLPHAMWLCYMIGKKLDDVDRMNRYLGNIQTILVYEGFWTQEKMMDRAAAWYKGDYWRYDPQTPNRPLADRARVRRPVGTPTY